MRERIIRECEAYLLKALSSEEKQKILDLVDSMVSEQ